MSIELKAVNRENWLAAISLQVLENQQKFTPAVAVSLAKVYIKPDGEDVVYIPFAIYNNEKMVGFIMHAYEEHTSNMYWINGFLIDAGEQRQGYGGAALDKMIVWIRDKFPQCREIRLAVHRENASAKRLYKRRGFIETGERFDGTEEVLKLVVDREL